MDKAHQSTEVLLFKPIGQLYLVCLCFQDELSMLASVLHAYKCTLCLVWCCVVVIVCVLAEY